MLVGQERSTRWYCEPIQALSIDLDGAFLCLKFSMEAAMCELTNEQVFSNWQECNRENRQQGADYWHDFMSKRAKRGYKGAQAVVDKMNRLK